MPGQFRELSARFPASTVRECSGLGVDIGGSAVKIFYRNKSDFDAVEKDKKAEYGQLHYFTCGRPDLDEALDKLKEEVYITPNAKIFSCGVGGYQFRKKLQTAFQAEIENVVEGDCLVEGLKFYMKNVPESELIYPPLTDIINQTNKDMMDRMALHAKMYEKGKNKFFNTSFVLNDAESRALSTDKSMVDLHGEQFFPYLIVHLGSNHGWLRVESDGTPKFCSTTLRGGRFFMGIASLLTGSKSYDEFIDLAEKGNNLAVDQSIHSLSQSTTKDEGDAYNAIADSNNQQVAYSFGNAVNQDLDKFRREDLALAWLMQHITDIVTTTHHAVEMYNIKYVFVAGSLANRQLVREHMTRELIRHDAMMVSAYDKPYQPNLYFLKNGGHLCSTGAMLNSIKKFTKDREAAT